MKHSSTAFPTSIFFFNDTATTEIYTLSLHDALPISNELGRCGRCVLDLPKKPNLATPAGIRDRKSTRLNSSHLGISYAVFCLEKKNGDDRRPARRCHGGSVIHVDLALRAASRIARAR